MNHTRRGLRALFLFALTDNTDHRIAAKACGVSESRFTDWMLGRSVPSTPQQIYGLEQYFRTPAELLLSDVVVTGEPIADPGQPDAPGHRLALKLVRVPNLPKRGFAMGEANGTIATRPFGQVRSVGKAVAASKKPKRTK